MVRIVFEDGLESIAREVAKSVDGEVVKLENAMNAPDVLEDISCVGLVYYKCGKDISDNMIKFIRDGLGSIELKNLEYLFSICVCKDEKNPQNAKIQKARPCYALRVVNRLCSHVGCLPSYSAAILKSNDAQLRDICNDIKKEEIKLPYGSPFATLYMKFAKKRFGM